MTINASSRMFEAFKNPLFLLGLLKIEAEVFGPLNLPADAIAERNMLWNRFVEAFLPVEKTPAAKHTGPRHEPASIPFYTLRSELVDLHDYLQETFPHRFQFTGLCTLARFLHNAHHTLVYNIQAETGTGQELLEVIVKYGKGGPVLLNPRAGLLAAYLENIKDKSMIVIREHSERLTYTWAHPEKAWFDLYLEVKNGATPYAGELVYILDDLLEMDLVVPARLRTLAKRRGPKTLSQMERFLPG